MIRDQKESLVDRAYGRAKSRILDATLLPDSFVDEGALAQELGISKTPVRQALNRLSVEGFIRILPQRGTLVNRISIADIQQVYLLRSLLEPAASELAATRATPEQIEALESLDEAFQSSDASAPDLNLHAQIHVGIARIAGVPRMTKMISELQDQMHWFLSVRAAEGGPLPPRHRHTDLIEAVKTGDPATARQITEESIRNSRDNIVMASSTNATSDLFSSDTFVWRRGTPATT